MQNDAADHLHVKVPHLQHALAGLANHCECFGQHLIERFTCGKALLELGGFCLQLGIRQF